MVNDRGVWRTTRLDEGTPLGALGDRLRVEAAYVLYRKNPELLVIPSGGKGMYRDIPDAPTAAEVIRSELLNLGVPKESIIKEEQSQNTWQELAELKKIISRENLSEASILSNRYHVPRIQAMIETDDTLRELLEREKIGIISAEEVLIEHDPERWQKDILDAYRMPEMQKRIAAEQKGVEDVRNGHYQFER